jgi:hypothetical protein
MFLLCLGLIFSMYLRLITLKWNPLPSDKIGLVEVFEEGEERAYQMMCLRFEDKYKCFADLFEVWWEQAHPSTPLYTRGEGEQSTIMFVLELARHFDMFARCTTLTSDTAHLVLKEIYRRQTQDWSQREISYLAAELQRQGREMKGLRISFAPCSIYSFPLRPPVDQLPTGSQQIPEL